MEIFPNNHSSKNIEKQDTPDKILGSFDKHILENGVPGVIEKILKEFNGKLPKVVIYPESSARPLYYVFDPVFEKISKIKNQDKPKIVFLKVHQPDTITQYYEDEGILDDNHFDKLKKNIIDHVEVREAERKRIPWPTEPLSDDEVVEEIKEKMERIQYTQDNRVYEKARVDEILEYLKKNNISLDDIVVIDEFVMEGDTRYEINKIFGQEIKYFAVFAISESESITRDQTAGYIVHEQTAEALRGTSRGHGTLSYKFDRRSIGVSKNIESKYVIPNNKKDNFTKQDTEMISKLRKEMRAIGEKIAEDLK